MLNVTIHYDLSNDMFKACLSPEMTYSCGLWLTPDHPQYTNDTLERSQQRKDAYHIRAAKIQSSDHVLEIGTGWGSFAIQAVCETGCRVTTVTLSKEQKELAEQRISIAGLSEGITVLLMDYCEVSVLGNKYNKIVSIEMLEHIGLEYLPQYFVIISELLTDDGVATLQASLMAEIYQKESNHKSSYTFICTYIFLGGFLPSTTQIVQFVTNGAGKSLAVDRIENLGGYGRVLHEWTDAFERNIQTLIRPEVVKANPTISEKEITAFKRK